MVYGKWCGVKWRAADVLLESLVPASIFLGPLLAR